MMQSNDTQRAQPARRPGSDTVRQAHNRRVGQAQRSAAEGQTLVEFSLTLLLFLLLTLGLLDGLRVIFYYSQIQEAAREGARWAAVEVGRQVNSTTPWGSFNDPGNEPTTYCASGCALNVTGNLKLSGGITNTVLGAASQAMTAVDLTSATVQITTTIPQTATEALQTDDQFTDEPVTVTITYPFKPLLGMVFGGASITLKGSSAMLHE